MSCDMNIGYMDIELETTEQAEDVPPVPTGSQICRVARAVDSQLGKHRAALDPEFRGILEATWDTLAAVGETLHKGIEVEPAWIAHSLGACHKAWHTARKARGKLGSADNELRKIEKQLQRWTNICASAGDMDHNRTAMRDRVLDHRLQGYTWQRRERFYHALREQAERVVQGVRIVGETLPKATRTAWDTMAREWVNDFGSRLWAFNHAAPKERIPEQIQRFRQRSQELAANARERSKADDVRHPQLQSALVYGAGTLNRIHAYCATMERVLR